jgi:hypothetical protein
MPLVERVPPDDPSALAMPKRVPVSEETSFILLLSTMAGSLSARRSLLLSGTGNLNPPPVGAEGGTKGKALETDSFPVDDDS